MTINKKKLEKTEKISSKHNIMRGRGDKIRQLKVVEKSKAWTKTLKLWLKLIFERTKKLLT